MADLDHIIRERRSVRGFLRERLVPRGVIVAALELAQRAPSNCNVQPWRTFIASGPACDRVRHALVGAAQSGEMPAPDNPVDEFPGPYRKLQVDCAVALYNEMGIERHDQAGRLKAFVRNFEFFDAPHIAMICMEQHFGLGVALDVGMYAQTLMLALWSRGVASCAQASLRMYPAIVRREMNIPDSLRIMCGVSFGYEDPAVPANRTRQRREPIENNVVFVDE